MKIGVTDIGKMYIGNVEIEKAYLGETIVFQEDMDVSTFTASVSVGWIAGPTLVNFTWAINNITSQSRKYTYQGKVENPDFSGGGEVTIPGNQGTGGAFQINTGSKPDSWEFYVDGELVDSSTHFI